MEHFVVVVSLVKDKYIALFEVHFFQKWPVMACRGRKTDELRQVAAGFDYCMGLDPTFSFSISRRSAGSLQNLFEQGYGCRIDDFKPFQDIQFIPAVR